MQAREGGGYSKVTPCLSKSVVEPTSSTNIKRKFKKRRVFGWGKGGKNSLYMHWIWSTGSMHSLVEVFNSHKLLLTGPQYCGWGWRWVSWSQHYLSERAEILKVKRSPRNWRVRQEEDGQQSLEKCLNSSIMMNWAWPMLQNIIKRVPHHCVQGEREYWRGVAGEPQLHYCLRD